MSEKSRRKRDRAKFKKVQVDETFEFGPLRIERFGKYIRFQNNATDKQQAAILARMGVAHGEVFAELQHEVSALQSLLQRYDPIAIMERAAYVLMPLFLKYFSENQFEGDEANALPAAEYLQYLISRTPVDGSEQVPEESEWDALWEQTLKVIHLTHSYLFTRPTLTTPPTEIDQLRYFVDTRRLGIRVRRYATYFSDHLRDALLPYERAIRDAYGITVEQLVQGFDELNAYQKSGVIDRYRDLMESNMAILRKLEEIGCSVGPDSPESDVEHARGLLQTEAFDALRESVEESARLALTPAIFDITELSSLPRAVLAVLSVRPGESILTTLTGPDHDDLSPLSTSPLHEKPFVEWNGRFYYFYHSGFEDRISEIIERDIFEKFPDREPGLRRKRDDYLEKTACDLLASIVKPEGHYRNLFYPNPEQPGTLTELDALLVVDDVLFLVEVKAGGFSAAARRGAPKSLYDELSDTIGTGQRQSERAEKYIKSADEVAFFDETGLGEIVSIRHGSFRRTFRIVVTREDLGWVGARIAILSVLEPTLNTSFPWHISLDDLRAMTELFKDSNVRFAHFLEQRLRASEETRLSQHDEIEHVALYNKINYYHDLPVQGMNLMSFDPSWMRDIDAYFVDTYKGENPTLPTQSNPPRVAALLEALRDSCLTGRFAAASIILDMDEESRKQLDRSLEYLDDGADGGRQRSVKIPFSSAGHGITVSYGKDQNWQTQLIRSAAQMEQSGCSTWTLIQLRKHSPYEIAQIESLAHGRFTSEELAEGYEYIRRVTQERISEERPGRNDRCPCGSGKKYKKCHGA